MSKPSAKSAAKPVGKTAKGVKKKGKGGLVPAFLILGVGAVLVLPASMVALAGLVPTLVMAMTDKSRAYSVTVAVGSLNLTGVVYVVIPVFQTGLRMDVAMNILQQPLNWLVMWGGAGLGLALLSLIPPVVAQVLTSISEFRLQRLRANQADIRKIWGDDVKE